MHRKYIEMDLREIGWGCMDWVHNGSGWGPVEGSSEHCNELLRSIKYLEILW
jgi:hypothetical protein